MGEQEQRRQRRWAIASMAVLIFDVIGFVVLAIFTLRTKIQFEKMFLDFGVAIPKITRFLVSIPSSLYTLSFGLLIAAIILKEWCIAKKPVAFTANTLVAIGGLVYLSVYVNAMLIPFIQMVQHASK